MLGLSNSTYILVSLLLLVNLNHLLQAFFIFSREDIKNHLLKHTAWNKIQNIQNNQHTYSTFIQDIWGYIMFVLRIIIKEYFMNLLHSHPEKHCFITRNSYYYKRGTPGFFSPNSKSCLCVSQFLKKISTFFGTFVSVSKKVLRTIYWEILRSLLIPTLIFMSSGDRSVLETVANVATSVPFVLIGLQTPRSAHSANCASCVKFSIWSIWSIIASWWNSIYNVLHRVRAWHSPSFLPLSIFHCTINNCWCIDVWFCCRKKLASRMFGNSIIDRGRNCVEFISLVSRRLAKVFSVLRLRNDCNFHRGTKFLTICFMHKHQIHEAQWQTLKSGTENGDSIINIIQQH